MGSCTGPLHTRKKIRGMTHELHGCRIKLSLLSSWLQHLVKFPCVQAYMYSTCHCQPLYMHLILSHFGKGEGVSCPNGFKMSQDSLATSLPSQGWSCETLDLGIREAARMSGIPLEPSQIGQARPSVHVTCHTWLVLNKHLKEITIIPYIPTISINMILDQVAKCLQGLMLQNVSSQHFCHGCLSLG